MPLTALHNVLSPAAEHLPLQQMLEIVLLLLTTTIDGASRPEDPPQQQHHEPALRLAALGGR